MFNFRQHIIIQAGDEDPRLFPLTSALSGQAMPKQFAFIAGGGSLLQRTVASYAVLLPRERITVVVSTKHEDLARTQLRQWRGISILARPLDCGSTVDLLIPLTSIGSCLASTNANTASPLRRCAGGAHRSEDSRSPRQGHPSVAASETIGVHTS